MSEITAQHNSDARTELGFWLYIMTDCVLFATLFATFAVLRNNTVDGPAGREIFDLPSVLAETILLLTSSFTTGLALLAARQKQVTTVLFWLACTFVLGFAFLTMEFTEFRNLVVEGNSWRSSGFLSAFFTLVGTHGAHITAGLLWLIVLAVRFLKSGISHHDLRKLTLFSVFWHFLDLVWIFIFSVVYLLGAA